MFYLCYDLMEKIGEEYTKIKEKEYLQDLQEHKNKFNNSLMEIEDLYYNIQEELIDDYIDSNYYHLQADYNLPPNCLRVREYIEEDEEIMNSIKSEIDNKKDSYAYFYLKIKN